MLMKITQKLYSTLPQTPGVYLMKNRGGGILYVGKAVNLRRRVSSYFLPARNASPVRLANASHAGWHIDAGGRPQDGRISRLVSEINKIDYRKTDTAIEALILESRLIKKYLPRFNIREKDDKSFLYVQVTKDKFPRVILVRGKEMAMSQAGKMYGPFTSAKSLREALKIIRRIFPFNTHPPEQTLVPSPFYKISNITKKTSGVSLLLKPSYKVSKKVRGFLRPCFDYEIGLCPGVCVGLISREVYQKNIRNIKLFFEGKKKKIIADLNREMRHASKKLEYEEAALLRKQIFSLKHIEDVALIGEDDSQWLNVSSKKSVRIEGYDISNISGHSAVGSMVVFVEDKPDKNEYRKFKIKTIVGANDTGMLKEVLTRRFNNSWTLPNFILIDGGVPQVNAAREIVRKTGLKIPVGGIAKGQTRKRNDFIGTIPPSINRLTLIRVRDEAHRFAISYHKQVRQRNFFQ